MDYLISLLCDCLLYGPRASFGSFAVYYKLHRARFFQSSAYALANLAVQCLYVLIDTLTFGPIIYFCSGFTLSGDGLYFWIFLLSVCMTGIAMGQFFRTLVSYLATQTRNLIWPT